MTTTPLSRTLQAVILLITLCATWNPATASANQADETQFRDWHYMPLPMQHLYAFNDDTAAMLAYSMRFEVSFLTTSIQQCAGTSLKMRFPGVQKPVHLPYTACKTLDQGGAAYTFSPSNAPALKRVDELFARMKAGSQVEVSVLSSQTDANAPSLYSTNISLMGFTKAFNTANANRHINPPKTFSAMTKLNETSIRKLSLRLANDNTPTKLSAAQPVVADSGTVEGSITTASMISQFVKYGLILFAVAFLGRYLYRKRMPRNLKLLVKQVDAEFVDFPHRDLQIEYLQKSISVGYFGDAEQEALSIIDQQSKLREGIPQELTDLFNRVNDENVHYPYRQNDIEQMQEYMATGRFDEAKAQALDIIDQQVSLKNGIPKELAALFRRVTDEAVNYPTREAEMKVLQDEAAFGRYEKADKLAREIVDQQDNLRAGIPDDLSALVQQVDDEKVIYSNRQKEIKFMQSCLACGRFIEAESQAHDIIEQQSSLRNVIHEQLAVQGQR